MAERWRGTGRHAPGEGSRTSELGFTLLELMVVLSIIALIAAITMVAVGRTRGYASEAWAVHTLRTIHTAQDAFRAACGHGRDYATGLPQLGEAEMISPDLVGNPELMKRHYAIAVTAAAPGQSPDTCTIKETAEHWYATATADAGSGLQGFATADGDDIWQDSTGKPPQQPFTAAGTVSRAGPR